MDSLKLRTACASKKRTGIGRCSSPVPLAPVPLKRGGRAEMVLSKETSHSKKKRRKLAGKVLPNIIESFVSDQNGNISMQTSTEKLGVAEKSEANEESPDSQMTVVHGTESICSNWENKANMKTGETASGISVPTGVSSYLINCLDTVSMSESTDSTSNLTIFSPEVLRGGDECSGGYFFKTVVDTNVSLWIKHKNSTLLDTSNAVDIDLLPQLSNVSEIIASSSKHLPGEQVERDQCVVKEASPSAHISTTIAGKHLYKMKHTMENTPTSIRRAIPSQPTKPQKNLSNYSETKKSRCKKKVAFSLPLDYRVPASIRGEFSKAISNVSVSKPSENVNNSQAQCSRIIPEKTRALLTSTPFCSPDDLALDISPVHMPSLDEELVPNLTGPFVCSSEIVPASPSLENSQHNIVPQSVMDINCGKAEFAGMPQNVEDQCQNIRHTREPKSYPLCGIIKLTQDDVYPKPKIAPTFRPIPKGIPIDFLTLL